MTQPISPSTRSRRCWISRRAATGSARPAGFIRRKWCSVRVRCDGASRSTAQPVEVDIPSGGLSRARLSTLRAEGSIALGRSPRVARVPRRPWSSRRTAAAQYRESATTTTAGVAAARLRTPPRMRPITSRSGPTGSSSSRPQALPPRLDADDRQMRRRARTVRPGRGRGEADARAPQVALRLHGHLLRHPAARRYRR